MSGMRMGFLPVRHAHLVQPAIDGGDDAYAIMLDVMHTIPGLEVVELSQSDIDAANLQPSLQPNLPPAVAAPLAEELSRRGIADAIVEHFELNSAVRLIVEPPLDPAMTEAWSLTVDYSRNYLGFRASGSMATLIEPARSSEVENLETIVSGFARRAFTQMYPDAGLAAFEPVIMDPRQTDTERLKALIAINQVARAPLAELSEPARDAAIELARASEDPSIRRQLWSYLGATGHPAYARPLVDAMLYDPATEVRLEAADTLLRYVDEPEVVAILEGVASGDPSPEVRLQARWTLSPGNERQAIVEAALLDTGLTEDQRMAPLALARDAGTSFARMDTDLLYEMRLSEAASAAVAEIARASTDPELRHAAIVELGRNADAEFLELARAETDAAIRRGIMIDLLSSQHNFRVREMLRADLETGPNDDVRSMIDQLFFPNGPDE
jgi:hypothetical protein